MKKKSLKYKKKYVMVQLFVAAHGHLPCEVLASHPAIVIG
jgi:hypothetical protein